MKNPAKTIIIPKKIEEIRLKDVYFIYKDEKIDVVAINNISTVFSKGTINVIMGPSGSGKTTLLNLIGGILSPSSGKIFLNNCDISDLTEREKTQLRKKKIGFIFQNQNLIPYLTIKDNFRFIQNLHEIQNTQNQKGKMEKIIKLLDIDDRLNHHPDELSGGQRQKIAIALALCHNPEIILADEPSGDLDSKSRDNLLELIKTIMTDFPDKIFIIVSHDPAFLKIADQAYFLDDRNIKTRLSKNELKHYSTTRYNTNENMKEDNSTFKKDILNIQIKATDILNTVKKMEIMKRHLK